MTDISLTITIYAQRDYAGKNWRAHEYVTCEDEDELKRVVDQTQAFQSAHGFTPIFRINRTQLISMRTVPQEVRE